MAYIDDILIQVDTKNQMFDRLQHFHESLGKSKLKTAPDKTYFYLAAFKFLDHVITENKKRPVLNRIEAIQQMKRPEFLLRCVHFFKMTYSFNGLKNMKLFSSN